MGKCVVFANQKGGVGKTTTALNLGASLANEGKKVLLIDFDPQGNLTSGLGISQKKEGIYEALIGKRSMREVTEGTIVRGLSLIPSNLNLSGATVELVDKKERAFYLKKALQTVKEEYDYLFIDCPPSLGILTINGFAASDSVIVPLQCEFFAMEGLITMLFETIKSVQKGLNPQLNLGGIVFTMYDSRTRLGNEVIHKICTAFKAHPDAIFKTVIPRNVKLAEAPSHGIPITLYDPNSVGALRYRELAKEVIERV